MDTRHDDDVGICVNCTTGESQRVTRDVGNAMEYFRCLVIFGITVGRNGAPYSSRMISALGTLQAMIPSQDFKMLVSIQPKDFLKTGDNPALSR